MVMFYFTVDIGFLVVKAKQVASKKLYVRPVVPPRQGGSVGDGGIFLNSSTKINKIYLNTNYLEC